MGEASNTGQMGAFIRQQHANVAGRQQAGSRASTWAWKVAQSQTPHTGLSLPAGGKIDSCTGVEWGQDLGGTRMGMTPSVYSRSCMLSDHNPSIATPQGHFEAPPYQNDSMRSAYHVRELDVYRLLQLRQPVDVGLSHDWPRGIANHGDAAQLFRAKSFLRREVCPRP